jgi:subfamily B ATP-binding cassette protein MsbA
MIATAYGRIREYGRFARRCFEMLSSQPRLFAAFLFVSMLGTATEGIGLAMIFPILQAQSGALAFQGMPYLGWIAAIFEGMTAVQQLQTAAIVLFLALVLRSALLVAVQTLTSVLPLTLQQQMISRSMSLFLEAQLAWINRKRYGEIISLINGYPSQVSRVLTAFASLLWNICLLVLYFILMLLLSWQVTVTILIFVGAALLGLRHFSGRVVSRKAKLVSDLSIETGQLLHDIVSGFRLVRLSAAEPVVKSQHDVLLRANMDARKVLGALQALPGPVLSLWVGGFICALLFVGPYLFAGTPAQWLPTVIVYVVVISRLLGPVTALYELRNVIAIAYADFHRAENERAEMEAATELRGTRSLSGRVDEVQLIDAGLSYSTHTDAALTGVSMTLSRGKIVALVGPSGAGKSSTIALIAGLYAPTQGRVLIDGVDLKDCDVAEWRRRLAVVSQDNFLFNRSIAENISFPSEGVQIDQIRAAAKAASINSFIETLPEGYETIVGERGVRLSGGQQQRVALARAFLRKPDLLILDEATSQLDSLNESALREVVEEIGRDSAVLIVAHRLSSVRNASIIHVMEAGRIAESGTHDELIARNGLYVRMIEAQANEAGDG